VWPLCGGSRWYRHSIWSAHSGPTRGEFSAKLPRSTRNLRSGPFSSPRHHPPWRTSLESCMEGARIHPFAALLDNPTSIAGTALAIADKNNFATR